MSGPTRILVVDNYDSFVYTIADYLVQLGADCEVVRNDAVTTDEAAAMTGCCSRPGRARRRRPASAWTWWRPALSAPSRCSASASATRRSERCTAASSRGRRSCCTARPPRSSTTASGVLAGLPSPFTATRYHSLAVERDTVPDELEITAHTASGIVMALRHRTLPLEGVQFHPESVLTQGGHRLLANWLAVCGERRRRRPLRRPGPLVRA